MSGATIPNVGSRSSLPASHPLVEELTALRQQLAQYQKSAHQSSIQLQGSKLELQLLKERYISLENNTQSLKQEVENLRSHPAPPQLQPQSTALTELSLAHRRLSAKLDLTESQLAAVTLELASSKQEAQRLAKERDHERAIVNELKRVEEDREEEIEWERAERKKITEQKKLCDLALKEYSTLVSSLDPSAVPPAIPSSSTSNILQSVPDLSDSAQPTTPSADPTSTSETISNLLIGQRGVHQLFNDFTSTLSAKERALHSAHAKIEQLEAHLQTLQRQLEEETALRVSAQNEREMALRDDGSAAKVVERYMTFTQKTHATVHMHLDNLRARSNATQKSLRNEIVGLQAQLKVEHERAEKLRSALEEMSEGLSREAGGRRREVGLRLKLIAAEEKRERKVEIWLDKVRRARAGAEGAVVEPDLLEVLLDEGMEAVETQRPSGPESKSWKRLLKRKPESEPRDEREESIARVLMAEELVDTLVKDLQRETERRVDLEKQRVAWLAKDAVQGIAPESSGPHDLVFDLSDHHDPVDVQAKAEEDIVVQPQEEEEPLRTPSPLPEAPPLLSELQEMFKPLTERYEPLQKSLRDLSHSLTSLRSTPPAPVQPQRKQVLNLSKRSDHILPTLLDSIHEVIEDARVDIEIALADEERVFRGFEALLGVGKVGHGVVQGKEVISDAEEYIADRREWEGYGKLEKRVGDIEFDITQIKRVVHEQNGLESEDTASWDDLDLRTVSVPSRRPSVLDIGGEKRRGANILQNVGSVGRSFSAGFVAAPRRVGSFAGGFVKPKGKEGRSSIEEEKVALNGHQDEDDVE